MRPDNPFAGRAHRAVPVQREPDRFMELAAIARWLKVPDGTARRWAHEDTWTRRRIVTPAGKVRMGYAVDEAAASFRWRNLPRRHAERRTRSVNA